MPEPLPRRAGRVVLLAALAAAIAACTVGPDHVRPSMPVPPSFGELPANAAATRPTPDANARFWESFDDPLLVRLVEDALVANHDLRIALARLDQADALLRGRRFELAPIVTATGQAGESRSSADQMPGVDRDARDVDSRELAAVASWELDLFGRVRRGIEAGGADAVAAEADLAALQVAVVAEVVGGYVELRGVQKRLQVARGNADNQRETLRLVEARLDAGRGTGFDSARARAQLEGTLSRVPALEAAEAVQMHRLAVLTGQAPGALRAVLSPHAPLPALPPAFDPGTPGELLRRRPDIRAAETRLHAATARIGVATADLFPRFTLGGLIGSQAIDSDALFGRDSETRLVALGIDWSFLDVGRVRARIAAAEAGAEGELAAYQQTVLRALEDTENALVRYARVREEDAHLARAAADSREAARLARVRFEAGAADLFEVLDAERTRLLAEEALAGVRTRSVTGAVSVYRALAGGWPSVSPAREAVAGRR